MHLADDAIAAYERDGFLCPIPVLTSDEVADFTAKLAARGPGDPR